MEKFRRRQLQDQKREARLMGMVEDGDDDGAARGGGGGRDRHHRGRRGSDSEAPADPEDAARVNASRGAAAALRGGGWRQGKGWALKAGERAAGGESGESDGDDSEDDAVSDGGSEAAGPARVASHDYTGTVDPSVLLMNAAKAATTAEGKPAGAAAAALAAYAATTDDAASGAGSADPATLHRALELRRQLSLDSQHGKEAEGADAGDEAPAGGKGTGKGGASGAGSAAKFLQGLPAADPAVADTTDRAAESAAVLAGEEDAPAGTVPSDSKARAAGHHRPRRGSRDEDVEEPAPAEEATAEKLTGDLAFNEEDSPEDQAVGAVLRRLAQWQHLNARERYYLEKFGVSCDMRVALHARVHHAVRRSFAESLQWCMLYYYQGVPSWCWFFPFHYAPFTSDLADLARYAAPVAGAASDGEDGGEAAASGAGADGASTPEWFEKGWNYRITFDHAQPFHPFMQLLGCLPAASSNFLPECYKRLMADRSSPLAQWFPLMQDIRVDMNGKKNPWEGVTLIPFLPESEMRDAVAKHCPSSAMTADERARNTFGHDVELQFVDAAIEGAKPVPSTLPGVWPSLLGRHSVEKPWENPTLPASGFEPVPCPGAIVPAPGFPTLHTLPLSPLRAEAQVVTVAFRSRKPSVLLFASEQGRTPQAHRLLGDAAPKASREWHAQARRLGLIEGRGRSGSAGSYDEHDRRGGGRVEPGLMLLQERKEAEEAERRRGGAGSKAAIRTLVPMHLPNLQGGYLPGTVPHSVNGLREAAAATGADAEAFLFQGASQLRPALGANAGAATAEQAAPLLGRVVYTGWPFLAPAMCVGVCDGTTEITFEGSTRPPRSRKLPHDEKIRFMSAAADKSQVLLTGSESNLLARCGVWIGGVSLVVTVRKLVGMKRDPRSGRLTRLFASAGSEGEEQEAAQLVFVGHPHPDDTFAEAEGKALQKRLPVGSKVVLLRPVQIAGASLGPKGSPAVAAAEAGYKQLSAARFAGARAVVVGYSPVEEPLEAGAVAARDGLDLAVVENAGAEPEFGQRLVRDFTEPHFDLRRASKMAGVSEKAFMAMAGSIWIRDAKLDVGLNLVVFKRDEEEHGRDHHHRGGGGGGRDHGHRGKGGGRDGEEEEHKINNYLYLPGYARPVMYNGTPFHPRWQDGGTQSPEGGTRWEYTQRAIDLVVAYARAFPSIAELATRTGGRGRLDVRAMGGGAVMVGVQEWLTQLVTFKMPLARPCSEVLATRAVQMLSRAQAAAAGVRQKLIAEGKTGAGGALSTPGRLVLRGVPPEGVFGREVGDETRAIGMIGGGDGVTGNAARARGAARWWADGPSLGDRVANLAFRTRPLGERGLVTAVHAESRYVEVLFDGQAVSAAEADAGLPGVPGAKVPGGTGPKPLLVPWHALLPLTAARRSVALAGRVDDAKGGGQARGGGGGQSRAPGASGFAAAAQSGAALAEVRGGPRAAATGGQGRSGDRGDGLAPELLQVRARIAVGAAEDPPVEELAALREAAEAGTAAIGEADPGRAAGAGAAEGKTEDEVELGPAGSAIVRSVDGSGDGRGARGGGGGKQSGGRTSKQAGKAGAAGGEGKGGGRTDRGKRGGKRNQRRGAAERGSDEASAAPAPAPSSGRPAPTGAAAAALRAALGVPEQEAPAPSPAPSPAPAQGGVHAYYQAMTASAAPGREQEEKPAAASSDGDHTAPAPVAVPPPAPAPSTAASAMLARMSSTGSASSGGSPHVHGGMLARMSSAGSASSGGSPYVQSGGHLSPQFPGGPMGPRPMPMHPVGGRPMHPAMMGPHMGAGAYPQGGPRGPMPMHPGLPRQGPGGYPVPMAAPGDRPGGLPLAPGGALPLPLPGQQQSKAPAAAGIVPGQPLPAGLVPKKHLTGAAVSRLGAAVGAVEGGAGGKQTRVARAPPTEDGDERAGKGSARGGFAGGRRGGRGGRGRGK